MIVTSKSKTTTDRVSHYETNNDPYIDIDFCMNNVDGFDWKASVFYDTEEKRWSKPVFFKSPDQNTEFQESEGEPPELVEAVVDYIRINPAPTSPFRAKKKRMTNEEFMSNIMNFSPYGGLVQGMILQGLYQYVKAIADADPKTFEAPPSEEGKIFLTISGEAWQGCARDLKKRLEEHMEIENEEVEPV